MNSQLDAGRSAFERALRDRDAGAAAEAYADDALLVAPDADILRGRGAIRRFWETGLETGIEDITLIAREVQQHGGFAFEIGEYALHVVAETGDRLLDRGRYLAVLRCEPDGQWRRAAEMLTPDRELAPSGG